MTLVVFGRTGQVATELQGLAPQAVFLGRDAADLGDPVACAAAIDSHAPSAVINAAAYTAVDRAEEEEDLATEINGAAPGAMAAACAARGIPFVQISTDYVFDGTGETAFAPDHPTAPLGAYGRSKLAGEAAVQAAGGAFVILRTSWVFSAHGTNFLKTMLRLGDRLDELTVIDDQVGGPTPASGIAAACLRITQVLAEDPGKAGLYHYAGTPDASWADFACEIFATSGQGVTVERTTTAAYGADKPRMAPRPLNSRLDCSTLMTQFGISRPDWRQAVRDIVKELI